jgi:type IV secretion system protein VirB5
MPSAFKRAPKPFGNSTPEETPYQRAAQAWDDRIGSARVQARNWRIVAFASLGLTFITLFGYIHERSDTHVATYVIPVDSYGRPGEIELAGRVYQPTRAETGYFLAEWVSWVRGRSPLDPIVNGQNIRNAFNFVQGSALGTLSDLGRAQEAVAKSDGGGVGVTVEVKSVLQRSPVSYQLEWTETAFKQGQPIVVTRWTGLFTTKIIPPATEAAMRKNPLGVYITAFQISQEITS